MELNFFQHSIGLKIAWIILLLEVLKKASDSRSSVDLQEYFNAFMMDAFGEILFDVKFRSIEAIANKQPHAVAHSFQLCGVRQFQRMQSVFWKQEKWLHARSLLNSPREKDITECLKVLNEFADGVIAAKRRTAGAGGQLGADLISRFIETKRNDLSRDVRDFSTQDLKDTLLTFMFAGYDSTSALLTWTFYELCRHPQCQ